MEKITGRTDDMMIVRGVNVFPTQIEEQILAVRGLTPHYLCVLTRPGRMDELTVQVEVAEDFDGDRTTLGAGLVRRVKDLRRRHLRRRGGRPARAGALARQGQADPGRAPPLTADLHDQT